jgi:hypothetical protein
MKAIQFVQEMLKRPSTPRSKADIDELSHELERLKWKKSKDGTFRKRHGDAVVTLELTLDSQRTVWAEGGAVATWSYDTTTRPSKFSTEHHLEPVYWDDGETAADFAKVVDTDFVSGLPSEPTEYPDDAAGPSELHHKDNLLDRF